MRARSYAKVNLWLRVVGKRDDGYHDIETIFHTVSLHDDLTLESAEEITVDMEPAVPINLAERAARALARGSRGARISIRKNIPLGAGLAGGSGNAAAVLLGLNRLWGLHLSDDELRSIASDLGSDVTYMLEGGTMLGLGRGERLTRLPQARLRLWFVLGMSEVGLSTTDVYRAWRPGAEDGSSRDDFRFALDTAAPELIAPAVRNDLEAPALDMRPELAEKKERLVTAGALAAFVSGSGPTLVGLARNEAHAIAVADEVRGSFDRVEVVRSQPQAVEFGP